MTKICVICLGGLSLHIDETIQTIYHHTILISSACLLKDLVYQLVS